MRLEVQNNRTDMAYSLLDITTLWGNSIETSPEKQEQKIFTLIKIILFSKILNFH